MNLMSKLVRKALVVWVAVLGLLSQSPVARAEVKLLHQYSNSLGVEVTNLIAVSSSKLLPLLPAGYSIVPALSVGVGSSPDQGVVVIVNYRGTDATIDHKKSPKPHQVDIDVAVLVNEPPQAVAAGVNIPGAFHLYTLAIYTDDPLYAASLQTGDMPVEFVKQISYEREFDDGSGVGQLSVNVPSRYSPFKSFNQGVGYAPQVGALNAVFWHDGPQGKSVLHYRDEPFRQGNAISQIYTKPQSRWDILFAGGGLSPCTRDPGTGFTCVQVPSLNFRYDKGGVGRLLLIKSD